MNILIVGNDYHELIKIAREAETADWQVPQNSDNYYSKGGNGLRYN